MSIIGQLLRAGIQSDGANIIIPRGNITARNMLPPKGAVYYVDGAVSSSGNGTSWARAHKTIAESETAVGTGGNGEIVLLAPGSYSQAAGLTWDANVSHLIGVYDEAMMNHRTRIGHSANFDALLTVSGYGNSFRNIYTMHGRGSATNLHALEITGPRNSFINCHIGGPMHTTEAGTAGYSVVELTNTQENYFKNCVFGIDTIERSAANTILRIGSASSRNIFENCIFLSMSGATTPYFIEILSTATYGWTFFRGCQFINFSSNWAQSLAVACLVGCAVQQHKLIFDQGCSFLGCTDIVAADRESSVWFNTVPSATVFANALGAGLPFNPDLS
jgi:hypothetical protein